MDKRELLNKTARTEEERTLLGQIWDRHDQCRERNIPTHTVFLSPAEMVAAKRLLQAMGIVDGFVTWGGYDDAERMQIHFLPDWAERPEEDTVHALRCTWYQGDTLTHRDFLGSLMGLGIVRETVGDILVDDHAADVLVADTVTGFLLESWRSAGRTKLEVREVALHDLHIPGKKYKEARDTVSSLRLDNVVAAGFSLSRGKAAEAVAAGKVQVNWTDCTRGDKLVSEGDAITLRGLGKIELREVGKLTKKGRISIVIRHYL